MELKGMLMKDAKARGICFDGYTTMKDAENIDALIDFYIQGIDWCLERSYPTLQFLREYFSDVERRGIFLDKKFRKQEFSQLQAYVFHNCTGTIRVAMDYENAVIPMLYFANNCHMRIECTQSQGWAPPIRVPLYIFGDNTITAENNENVTFTKYQMDVL
jgi:hypothetical protein